MEPNDNINSFITFLKQNFEQFKSLNQNNTHLNWKGQETKDHSNDLERINFFTPEFASYFSSKLLLQKIMSPQNLPYTSKELLCRKYNYHSNRKYELINKSFAHSRSSFIIIYLADKDAFISGADDGTICVWSSLDGKLVDKRKFHSSHINHLEYCTERQLLVSSDLHGKICFVDMSSDLELICEISTEREIDKLIIFNFSESFRLFASFKNGPYAIYAAEDSFAEIYRSGASYKESAILKSQDTSYFVVKTTAGIFSINFCHDSQETWFLADEDPIYLLSNTSKCLLVVICNDGKVLGFVKSSIDNRPELVCERLTEFDFSTVKLIQIFESNLICVKFEEGKSQITVFSILKDNFFGVIFQKTLNFVCYFFAENPVDNTLITFVTVDGCIIWLDLQSGNFIQEKKISSGINEMIYSNNGKVLALLDDSGSVTFFSTGHMPCDGAKLFVYNDKNTPKSFSAHVNLTTILNERTKPQLKRKRESNIVEDKKKTKTLKRTKSDDETNYLPYWSSVYTNQAFPYVPQLKDSVVYFPDPHLYFLKRNGRKLKEKINYVGILPTNKLYFEGIIEELHYIPDNVVKCKLVLKLMIGRKWTKIDFHYFFGINQPNFIVLKSAYNSNSDLKFKSNETVKIRVPPCQDENGIILEIKDDTEQLTNFGTYKVLCHKKNYTAFLSHWEIGKLRGSKEFIIESINAEDKSSLIEILQQVLDEERWIPFRYPVDFSEYPEYYAAVPYPMYIELIFKRLKNDYYRQNASFLWDINQILVDALIFNESDSDIVKESKNLVEFVTSELKRKKIKS